MTYFSKSFSNSKTSLENESAEAINWLKQINMLVNANKIQVAITKQFPQTGLNYLE